MAAPTSSSGPITGINMTPFVDITLVLLIIFIVTAKFVVTPAVPLELPQAAKSESVQSILSVVIEADGRITANGRVVEEASALVPLAAEQLAKEPELRVVIAADGEVSHREVMAVLDALRVGGITKLAFGVEPVEEASR